MKNKNIEFIDWIVDITQKNSTNLALVAATLALIPSLILSISLIALGNPQFNITNITKIYENPHVLKVETDEITKFLVLMVSRTQKSIIFFVGSSILLIFSKMIYFGKKKDKILVRIFSILSFILLFLGFFFLLLLPSFYIK